MEKRWRDMDQNKITGKESQEKRGGLVQVCLGEMSEIESRKGKVRGRTTMFLGNHSRANNLSVNQAYLYLAAWVN